MLPESVRSPLVLPEQIVEPPVTMPPTVVGLTVTVVASEFFALHSPLFTTALNWVVAVNASDEYVVVVAPEISVHGSDPSAELCHYGIHRFLPVKKEGD